MIVLPGVPPSVQSLVQDRTLERMFHEALFPKLLFRMEAKPELWPANLGDRMVFTRSGEIPVKLNPLTPGTEPVPSTYQTEQWEALAAQYSDTIDVDMPTNYVTMSSTYLEATQKLGENAGKTLNRLVRNRLMSAYLGGESVTTEAAALGATQLRVASVNGFLQKLENGQPQPITAANPLVVALSILNEPDNEVIAAIPDNAAVPLGPGTIFLRTGVTQAIPLRTGVRADNRSRIYRVTGGNTIDSITGANVLTLQDINNAVAILRASNVPVCSDGAYHVHISPLSVANIFGDNQWQRLHQSLPDSTAYQKLAIGQISNSRFYENSEMPNLENSNAFGLFDTSGGSGSARLSGEIGAEVVNQAGIPIDRTIIVGGAALVEKYLDESKFITEGGVTGKVGQFSVTNQGTQVMTDRIRYILRSPQGRLQQEYSQSWSWSGDFPVPSDQTTGNSARYKRAIIIEHA